MAKILIIDDEPGIRSSLKAALERRGHETVTAENYTEGKKFYTAEFDLILLDVMLPDGNGIDLLKEIRPQRQNQAVVMISGQADIDMAVEAIRAGAYDFIEKPLSLDRVLITIDNVGRSMILRNEKDRLSLRVYGEFIGESTAIRKLKEEITLSAPKASRFLILGENGTGKELVAHLIHRHGRHPDGPFVAVNCAALPSELVESELFGHIKGAYTGAGKPRKGRFLEASGGSIFLDEISEMSPEAQAKILRAIETGEITPVGADKPLVFDCNIIAASNKDLDKLVAEDKFRQDLLYRLNVVQFRIVPLRERRNDIPLLAGYFLDKFASETGSAKKEVSDSALQLLMGFPFPGNIRELKNLMERINIYCPRSLIEAKDISPLLPHYREDRPMTLKEAAADFERDFIQSAIERHGGNITEAARRLGLERSHLYKKMKKYQNE